MAAVPGVDALKAQLRELRSEYLKEIATLRDLVRQRDDPLEQLADLRYFYEPLHCLDVSERDFMISLLREVLKMMVRSPREQPKASDSWIARTRS